MDIEFISVIIFAGACVFASFLFSMSVLGLKLKQAEEKKVIVSEHSKPAEVEKYEKSNPGVPPHVLHYMAGKNNTLSIIKLALFKMYSDGELLNYESLMEGILRKISTFDNKEVIEHTAISLTEYINKLQGQSGNTGGPAPSSETDNADI